MPFTNFIAARIHDPSKYKRIRYKKDAFGDGIDAVYGIPKQGEDTEVQAIRFSADIWTPSEAKKWLKDHDYKWIEFETAKPVKEGIDIMIADFFRRILKKVL